MDRRSFLKVLGAAGLAVTVPAALVAAVTPQGSFIPTLTGFTGQLIKFIRLPPCEMDYGYVIGLAAELRIGEDRYRHGIRLPTESWQQFTQEQREETWKFLERTTYEFAMKRRTS